jgi:methyltransferase (TIGR00027 family)
MFTTPKAVAYPVQDLGQAKQWYTWILGKGPVFDSPFAVVFLVGDSALSLVPCVGPAPEPGRIPIVYWGVEDADGVRQQLLSAGAVPRGEVNTSATGNRNATVVDPFGNILGITSSPSPTRRATLENQPSDSALGVTFFRAMAAKDGHEEIRGPDYLAEVFLTDEFRSMLQNSAGCEWIKSRAPGSYEFFLARTAFFDHAVQEALCAGVPQVVFLGAGYDSRPYRFRDLIQKTRIYELDVDSTQNRKRQLLAKAGIPASPALTYVAADFSREELPDVLLRAGFDPAKRTLYVWEGVMYYLPPQAVDQTLQFIRQNSPPGSTLCLDYMIDAPDMATRYGVMESEKLMRERYHAEPIQTRILEGTIADFLAIRGFAVKQHLKPAEIQRRFLTLRDGSSAGRVLAWFGFVEAVVNGSPA